MALYLLPTPRNECVKRASKTLAKLRFATKVGPAIPAPDTSINLGKAEPFAKWKALQAKSNKGVVRWM